MQNYWSENDSFHRWYNRDYTRSIAVSSSCHSDMAELVNHERNGQMIYEKILDELNRLGLVVVDDNADGWYVVIFGERLKVNRPSRSERNSFGIGL